ncbi:MAG: peptidoglycan-binding domain-containing protein [Solirubrobacteraceae bacterium]
MFQVPRRAVPLLAGLLTLCAVMWSVGSALARTHAGDPDTAHRANAKQVVVTVARGTHQVHVHGVPDVGVVHAASNTGGGGLGGPTTTPTKKRAKSHRSKQTVTTTNPIDSSDPVLAPVVQDVGSQHLGERTLKVGMQGHDVRVLQGYLTVAGYPTSIDGDFGQGTQTNAMKFETGNALTADGIVTYPQTRVLRGLVAKALAGGAVTKATINTDGTASAPSGAPPVVQQAIAAANQIIDKPYIYAGGHARWNDNGYDCSGSVSFALHGAGLLSSPEDSTGLESFGSPGPGKWITIYANASHTWVVVAGIAFDTAHYGPTTPGGTGPRWLSDPTGNLADGGNYVVRHPSGL